MTMTREDGKWIKLYKFLIPPYLMLGALLIYQTVKTGFIPLIVLVIVVWLIGGVFMILTHIFHIKWAQTYRDVVKMVRMDEKRRSRLTGDN